MHTTPPIYRHYSSFFSFLFSSLSKKLYGQHIKHEPPATPAAFNGKLCFQIGRQISRRCHLIKISAKHRKPVAPFRPELQNSIFNFALPRRTCHTLSMCVECCKFDEHSSGTSPPKPPDGGRTMNFDVRKTPLISWYPALFAPAVTVLKTTHHHRKTTAASRKKRFEKPLTRSQHVIKMVTPGNGRSASPETSCHLT